MITKDQLIKAGIDPEAYDRLSDSEKKVVNDVLAEVASQGSSEILDDLYNADYDERPVDFITFITDDNYLGKSTRNGQFLYPFWKKEISKIYSLPDICEVAFSGSIGVGKTTCAVLAMIYHLYRTMCMRDPQAFFDLSPGSEITYAFLNNTMDSSYGVAYKTFQAFIQESPWFLKHGRVLGRTTPEYYPDKGFGFIVGSRVQHTLGRHIICLTGDTEIVTSDGVKRIDDLVNKTVRVVSYNESKGQILSEECIVRKTGVVSELIEIELEDGTTVRCTPEHRWMLTDGTYKMAKDLSEDDELLDIN